MYGKPQISSFSDDKTVKIWDIPTEKTLTTYEGHTDYIRAGATCQALPDIILSGGYDNKIRMLDTRTENEGITVDHGSPVESLLFLPAGGIFLSAGGTEIKIWDSIAGGRLLGNISQHHKTITCMTLASDNKRLLSGSLDRHVKIYDVSTFKTVHTLDFPNAILSLGVSKNDDTLVAGLVDGLVSINRREEQEEKDSKPTKKVASYQFISNTYKPTIDTIVTEVKYDKESKVDRHLRKFEYSRALDSVLLPYIANKSPQITISLIQELIRRRALQKAFQNRDKKSLTQTLRFFIKNITDYRFTRILINAANIFLDIYEDSISLLPPEVAKLFIELSQILKQETDLINNLVALQGMLSMLLASQITNVENISISGKKGHNLVPSIDAQKNFVLTLS